MKRGTTGFILGILVGAIVFGGSVAYAAGVMAQPKTAVVVIDGQTVDLKGYVIEGTHYFQLRDLDAALISGGKDFSVVWDGANNRVLIDTARGYDPNETLPTSTTTSPQNTTTPTQTEAPTTAEVSAMTIDEMKAEIVRLTNAERVKAGLPELKVLSELMDCAQAKAQDFIDNHYFGHNSPVYGTAGEMIKAAIPAARSYGENIATWTSTPAETVSGWMDSQGHREYMLSPKFTHIGVGIVEGTNGGYAWVLQFVTV